MSELSPSSPSGPFGFKRKPTRAADGQAKRHGILWEVASLDICRVWVGVCVFSKERLLVGFERETKRKPNISRVPPKEWVCLLSLHQGVPYVFQKLRAMSREFEKSRTRGAIRRSPPSPPAGRSDP